VVQGASRTPTIAALDAMAEVFSDARPKPFFNIIDKRCAPHTHRYKGLTPLRINIARLKCGQFGVLFSGD
jgi:hypothetical protein